MKFEKCRIIFIFLTFTTVEFGGEFSHDGRNYSKAHRLTDEVEYSHDGGALNAAPGGLHHSASKRLFEVVLIQSEESGGVRQALL